MQGFVKKNDVINNFEYIFADFVDWEVDLSCYLVLLSFDSKTKKQDRRTFEAWSKYLKSGYIRKHHGTLVTPSVIDITTTDLDPTIYRFQSKLCFFNGGI